MLKNDIRYIIKRVLVAVLIAFILFFLKTNKILAATCPTFSTTYDTRYTSIECTSIGSCIQSGWGTWNGQKSIGTQQTYNTSYDPSVLNTISVRMTMSGTSKFVAGNTYTFVSKFTMTQDYPDDFIKDWEVWTVSGGTSSSNLSPANISSFSYTFRRDNANSKIFYLTVQVSPQVDSTIINYYYRNEKYNAPNSMLNLVRDTSITLNTNTCAYAESSNSYIEKNTIEIINQTKEIIKMFNLDKEQLEYLQDDTDAAVDVSGMTGITGLLPPGPLDSLLSIPITILNIFIDSTSGTCSPFTFTFVFNEEFTLPCFDVFWNQVPSSLMLFMSDLPAVILFVMWAKSIYKRVERATSFESSVDDEWGGV